MSKASHGSCIVRKFVDRCTLPWQSDTPRTLSSVGELMAWRAVLMTTSNQEQGFRESVVFEPETTLQLAGRLSDGNHMARVKSLTSMDRLFSASTLEGASLVLSLTDSCNRG